jgi:hypothetical protein
MFEPSPMLSFTRLPIELWIYILESLHEDGLSSCVIALVSQAFNALVTPIIYRNVNIKALPTLLARPHLRHIADSATLDATHTTPPLCIPDALAAQLQLSPALHAGLQRDRAAAKCALLAQLCTRLRVVHAIFAPGDADLFTLYAFVERHPGLPRVAAFSLAPPRADADAPAPAYFSLGVLASVLRLPAIRAVRAEALLCDAASAGVLAPSFGGLRSRVRSLALADCQLSAPALALVLAAAPRLQSLALAHWPDLAGTGAEPEALDLRALGAALPPGLRALALTLAGDCGDEYAGALTRLAALPHLARLAVPVQFLGLRGRVTGEALRAVVPATVEHLELILLADEEEGQWAEELPR